MITGAYSQGDLIDKISAGPWSDRNASSPMAFATAPQPPRTALQLLPIARGGQKLRDAMDPRNFHRGHVEMLHIDGLFDEDTDELPGEGDRDIQGGYAEAMCPNPTRKIQSAIDLADWMAELDIQDQEFLELRASGRTLEEIVNG